MTALAQYARLETLGHWRPAAGDAGREVVVSFGDATLVLADGDGRPLTHWSLPAVARLNPGATPALFAPDEDGSETLAIDDDLMVSAIEKVRASVHRGRAATSRPRRARGGLAWLLLALALLPLLLWAPGALRREALAVLPPSKQAAIGATLLGHLQAELGPACAAPLGAEALERLRQRVLGGASRAVVLPLGPPVPLALPGGIVVLSRDMVERATEPAVVAGHLLAAVAAPQGADPLARLFDQAGTWATLRLLTSGDFDPSTIEAHAESLMASPVAVPDAARLGPAFAAAEVPLSPYALDLDPSGDSVGALLNADAYRDAAPPPLLTDSDWVALQEICQGA